MSDTKPKDAALAEGGVRIMLASAWTGTRAHGSPGFKLGVAGAIPARQLQIHAEKGEGAVMKKKDDGIACSLTGPDGEVLWSGTIGSLRRTAKAIRRLNREREKGTAPEVDVSVPVDPGEGRAG